MVNSFFRNPTPNSPKPTSEPAQKQDGDIILPDYSKGVMPCKIVFLSGPYKGKPLNLGNGIVKSDQSQQQNRRNQEGHSLRLGSNFVNISARDFNLTLEFYSPDKDISEWVENCMTLQQIDPATGNAPTLLYTEGAIQSVAPLVCRGIKVGKEHPFPGGKGFHYAKVDISLELLGGKDSAHRFAPPLMETELTKWSKSVTDAERERQGTISVTQQALASCLTATENQQLTNLLEGNKAGNTGAVANLSSSALIQAAVAGLIPKETLEKLGSKLDDAIATEIARKTNGVGRYADRLANAIQSGNTGGLPADLKAQVERLQVDYAAIKKAIVTQDLGRNSSVFGRSTAADTLIKIAKCGIEMRQGGAVSVSRDQSNPPEWDAWFQSKLGQKASDQVACDQFVKDEVNKALSDKNVTDAQIVEKFGLANDQQAKKLRNYQPFRSKEDFILRAGSTGLTGRAVWANFIDNQVASDTSTVPVIPGG